MRWAGRPPTLRGESAGAGLVQPGEETVSEGHKTSSPSSYEGFTEKMDLGSLLRCSVEEKGQQT